MSYDLRDVTREAVVQGMAMADPPITAAVIKAVTDAGQIGDLIDGMLRATREAASWGAASLGSKPSSEELDAIALSAVLDAFALVVPPDGAVAIVQATLSYFLDLGAYTDESISEAIYAAALDLGLEMRSARALDVITEAEELIGRYIEL